MKLKGWFLLIELEATLIEQAYCYDNLPNE